MDINEGNDVIDGRSVPVFNTLTERQENIILNYLIDFMYYYSLLTGIKGEVDGNKVFQYFVKNIKKPYSLQQMLTNTEVAIDAINYIQQWYQDIIKIKAALRDDELNLFLDVTKEYNKEHHLIVMQKLLKENQNKEEVKAIINYLNKHNITNRIISEDYIKRIINKVYEVI